mmetsp:Transcript_22164/g.39855  ORF Transcript_22164/g.39855 Transcript_22164/m.39855 type:complete len:695 (+) Transcript_22164:50-2134(+)
MVRKRHHHDEAPADLGAIQKFAEDLLEKQLGEMINVVQAHHEQAKNLMTRCNTAAKKFQIENLELRAQIAQLMEPDHEHKKKVEPQIQPAVKKVDALKQAQQHRAHDVLLKRDEAVRAAEQENAALREQLAALKAASDAGSVYGGSTYRSANEYGPLFETAPVSPIMIASPKGPTKRPMSVPAQKTPIEEPPAIPTITADTVDRLNRAFHSPVRAQRMQSDSNVVDDLTLPGQPVFTGEITADSEDTETRKGRRPQRYSMASVETMTSEERERLAQRKADAEKTMQKQVQVLQLKDRVKVVFNQSRRKKADNYADSGFFPWIARHQNFENIMVVVIILNAIWLGIDNEYNDAGTIASADAPFVVFENIFCCAFTLELIIRFMAYEEKSSCLKDLWFVFDAAVLVFMIWETWVLLFIGDLVEDNGAEDNRGPSSGALKVVRLLRITRVARIIRLLRFLPEVMVLLKSMGVASRSVFFTTSLLAIVIYVFALVFSGLCEGTTVGDMYFRGIFESMFTLFFYVCFADGLPVVARALFEEHVFLGLVLIAFIMVAPLTVMNMLVGVLVQVVKTVAVAEQETIHSGYLRDMLTDNLEIADEDKDARISQEEFADMVEKRFIIEAFQEVGLDVFTLIEHPDIIFKGASSLTYNEFVDELLLLRGSNTATVKDMITLQRTLVSEVATILDEQMLGKGGGQF